MPLFSSLASPVPTSTGLEHLEQLSPGLWVHPRWSRALCQAGLGEFEALMSTQQGELLRRLSDRENRRLELLGPDGPVHAYLKKHLLRYRFGLGTPRSPARNEAYFICRLPQQGIPTVPLIAFGEKRYPDGRWHSLVLTQELEGFEQLDEFLLRRFPPREPRPWQAEDRHLRTLVHQVAQVVRRFHGLGYNHRDLYCCHFFIREESPGRYLVHLIDLQRVQHRRHFRRRWLVKDLAQLTYSAPWDRIGCTLRMAFLREYLGTGKLQPHQKRFVRRVLWKAWWMQRTLGPYR